MAYPILGNPKPAFFDSNGSPLASGTITILDPADDSVKASYPTADDANASTNGTSGDITLDSRGEPSSTQLWGKDGEDYKIVIKDSSGATVYTLDDIRLPDHSRRSLVTASASDATPSIVESDMIKLNDTTITDFDGGEVGDIIHVFGPGSGSVSVTANASILLKDEQDFAMETADTLTLKMFEDQKWHEIARSYNVRNNRFESVSSANTITAGESGKTFFLNLAGGFASTLPSPERGLKFKFIVQTAPTTAYTIVTSGSSNIIYGTIFEGDGTAAAASAEDTVSFVANTSLVGDWVELVSDGTNWHMIAFTSAGGGITATAT